jgi:hypothetical protein
VQLNLTFIIIAMEMENFEEKLIKMTKPEISQLKHQDMLEKAIINARDKSVVSLWWLCIPIYLVAALIMKSIYIPKISFISTFHELIDNQGYMAVLLFIVLPAILIIINLLTIRQLFYLYGNTKAFVFIKTVKAQVLIIILSLLILIIYFL